MDDIISKCQGCVSISDDVVVVGSTEKEHDERLHSFVRTARQDGLMFNSKKCVIKSKEVSFFGLLYTQMGAKPDPQKVEDIVNMPSPQSKQDLQRFLGMVNLEKFHKGGFNLHMG